MSGVKIRGSERFTVQPGDRWDLADGSVLLCGDLIDADDFARLSILADDAAIFYSDPPWGPGNARYWRTVNGQRHFEVDYDLLLTRVASIAALAQEDVFVEMGLQWQDENKSAFERVGLVLSDAWVTLYGNPKRPNMVQRYQPAGRHRPLSVDPTNLSGEAVTWTLLGAVARPGATVVDPCGGFGMTLRVAVGLGMRVVLNELNPKRVERQLDWAARNNLNPQRSGLL